MSRNQQWRLSGLVNQFSRFGDSMDRMNDLIVRRASAGDVAVLASLIDEFAKGQISRADLLPARIVRAISIRQAFL
jgi:arginine repressor